MALTMFILAQIPKSDLLFPSLEKLQEGGLGSVWRPELIAVGVRWNEVQGRGVCRSWFSEARDWSQFFTLVKREADWGNVLNTCNRWNLVGVRSVAWSVGGRRRRVHCLQGAHRREEGVKGRGGKITRLVPPQIPAHHSSFPSDESWVEQNTSRCALLPAN